MPRKTDSRNPRDWILIAESDMEGIRLLVVHETGYLMCHSKLAEVLEKVLKAELIRSGWSLLKTHDLSRLMDELQSRDPSFAREIEPVAKALAEVYFVDRYPGFDLEDPDWPDLRKKVEQVVDALAKVKARIK